MKQSIENWLRDNTVVVKAHDGTFRICLPHKFEFGENNEEKGADYDLAISETASQIAAHIENARAGH